MVLYKMHFVVLFGLLLATFYVGAKKRQKNSEAENRDSYLEICEKGMIRRISPTDTRSTKEKCEDIVQFNFKPNEAFKRIRVFGVFLVLNATTGCAKRVLFGHGQCKDIRPGIALRIMRDGIWHDAENKTFSIMFNILAGTIQAIRLPQPKKETITIPEGTTFFTLSGDVADLEQNGAYCLLEDRVNHTKIISQKHVMQGGTIQFGGTPDECPYSKYFNPSLHTTPSAIILPTELESCELPCENDQVEGAGPGPVDTVEAEKLRLHSSREDLATKSPPADDPLATAHAELATEVTTALIEDNATTTLTPLPDDDVPTPPKTQRKKREIGHAGPISCIKTFPNKCMTGISSFNLTTLEKIFG